MVLYRLCEGSQSDAKHLGRGQVGGPEEGGYSSATLWAKKLVGKLCREGLRDYCARIETQAQWQQWLTTRRVKKVIR